jgi:hypothetical protein
MADRPAKSATAPGARPRLAVIEGFAGRRSAIPFALLILAVLGIGLVALLMLNTAMDEDSVRMQQAQQRQASLTDREQQLSQQLSGLSAPSALASQAAALGLVPNPQPAFIDPGTGAVLGTPSPAPTPSPIPTPTTGPTTIPGQTPTSPPSGSASATASGTAGSTPTVAASSLAITPNSATAPSGARAPVRGASTPPAPQASVAPASVTPPASASSSRPASASAPSPSSDQPAGSPR